MAKNRPKDRRRKFEEWARESARKLEASAPRKHHVVPGSYLRRWEHDGFLWVFDRVARTTFQSKAEGAARETDFYRLEGDGVDSDKAPPLLAEFTLSQIEGAAVPAFDALIASPGAYNHMNLARFEASQSIAIQALRGRRIRSAHEQSTAAFQRYLAQFGRDAASVRARSDVELTDEQVASIIEVNERLAAGEMRALPTQASSIAFAFNMLETFTEEYFHRRWLVYESEHSLVTADEPVVALGGRLIERGSIPGPKIAGLLMIPLDPHHLLAMFHRDLPLHPAAWAPELSAREVDELNLEIAAHAHRTIIRKGGPNPLTLPSLPPPVAPAQLEDPVPLVNDDDGGEIIALFHPSPWLYAPRQPLPVERWWYLDERTYSWKRPDSPWTPKTGVYVNEPD